MTGAIKVYVYRDNNRQALRNTSRGLLLHCWAWYCGLQGSGWSSSLGKTDDVPQLAPEHIFRLIKLVGNALDKSEMRPPITWTDNMRIEVRIPIGNPFGFDEPPALVCWDGRDGNGYTAAFVEIPQLTEFEVYRSP